MLFKCPRNVDSVLLYESEGWKRNLVNKQSDSNENPKPSWLEIGSEDASPLYLHKKSYTAGEHSNPGAP